MFAVPPGFTERALNPIQYSFAFPPKLLGNPLTGDLSAKITINCYTWTAYAAGLAIIVSIIPIR